MWFLLEGHEDQVGVLNGLGIPAATISANTNFGTRSGISFPDRDAERVLATLGLDRNLDHYEKLPTNQDNTVYFRLREEFEDAAESGPRVTIESHEDQAKAFRPVFRKWADQLGISIRLFNPHQGVRRPEAGEGTLYIYNWGVPTSGVDSTHVNTIFGERMEGDGQSDALEPTGRGTAIRDDDGHIVAEVLPWNIYVLNDLVHHGNESSRRAMDKIIEASLPAALGGASGDISAKIAAYKKQAEKRRLDAERAKEEKRQADEKAKIEAFKREIPKRREAYIKACSSRLAGVFEQKQKELQANRKQAEKLTQALVKAYQDLEILEAEVKGLEAGASGAEKFGAEFDALTNNPSIDRVEVDGRSVKIYTKDMCIDWNSNRWNFGPFLIDCGIDGTLRMYSLRYSITNSNDTVHPHVKQGSAGCLGNIGADVAKLIAQHEFSILAQLIIAFLQSYNPENPYNRIENFRSERA